MALIKLLPENMINRIAAGEVVERPASILKELLENSLDAGAAQIDVEILSGGKKLIRVRDNGRGMDEDDLYLCLERHATSKINENSDLMNIATLGFRGEALPSIGSVARLTITSAAVSGEGHEIKVSGGRLEGVRPAPSNIGTCIEVADLFYNVPARRKFLKAESTESSHLLDIAQRYAISREGLRLTFREGARELLSVDSQNDFRTRVYKVMGRQVAERLTPFDFNAGDLRLHGWLGDPSTAGRGASGLFLYVLGRPVRDRLLTRAIAQGYGRLLPAGRWPAAIIFVELDPSGVDVNVHPSKAEVRFRQPDLIFTSLANVIGKTVGASPLEAAAAYHPSFRERWAPARSGASANEFGREKRFDEAPRPASESSAPPAHARPITSAPARTPEPDFLPPWMREPEVLFAAMSSENTADSISSVRRDEAEPVPRADRPSAEAAQKNRPDEPSLAEGLWPIGQLHNSYILAQGPAGLYVIDQHAAHERIIFNQLREKLKHSGLPSQARLFPDSYELPPHQALAAEELSPTLLKLGFELTHFGGRAYLLKSAPAILGGEDPWPTLLEILTAAQGRLKALEGAGMAAMLEDMASSWLYSIACRAAVKAGQKMSVEEMVKLIADLAANQNGGYCPHGRPSVFILSRAAIDKKFDR